MRFRTSRKPVRVGFTPTPASQAGLEPGDTVAVNVTVAPNTDGEPELDNPTVVPAAPTVWVRSALTEPEVFVSPAKLAVIVWSPTARPTASNVDTPEPSSRPVPIAAATRR